MLWMLISEEHFLNDEDLEEIYEEEEIDDDDITSEGE